MPKYRRDELESFQQAYLTGRELADAGALEDAIACFDKVLGKLPRRNRRRAYHIAASSFPRAADVLALPAVFRDALLAKAYCLNELGRFDDAFAVLQRALELDPENPRVYAELGFTHGERKDVEHARQAYHHALELEPNNPDYLRALAHIALFFEDDYATARLYAERALSIDAGFVPCLQQIGYIEYRQGNLEEALRVLRHAASLDPDDREVLLPLASIMRECGDPRAAIAMLTPYLDAHPADTDALDLLIEVLQQDVCGSEVVPQLLRILERHPDYPAALDVLSWAYYRHGQMPEALEVVNRLVAVAPAQPHHRFKQGIILQSLGEFAIAMASFMRVQNLDAPHELKGMAAEAISTLDRAQLEHLLARLRIDQAFRDHLQQHPEATLHQAGYLLSPIGLQMLIALDLNDDGAGLPLPPTPTVH